MKPPIPWLRVFVEGVVIVGSILLAFGLQAWWEERQEWVDVRAHLEALAVEVAAQKQEAQNGVARRNSRVEVMRSFVSVITNDRATPPTDTLNTWLASLWGAWDPLPPLAALSNLHESGSFPSIRSDELRLALARLERDIEGAARHDERVIHAWENGLRAYLIERSDGLAAVRVRGGLELQEFEPVFGIAPSSLLTDPVFQNLLLARMNRTVSARSHAIIVVRGLDEVAVLIEQELSS